MMCGELRRNENFINGIIGINDNHDEWDVILYELSSKLLKYLKEYEQL